MKKLFFLIILFQLIAVSCDKKEEGISDNLILEVSNPYGQQLITGYTVPFKAVFRSGNEVTSNATFYIDGQAQTSHQLVFSQPGTHQVTASITLDGQTINSSPFEVQVIVPRHTTKILLEDYTGTWCSNCPRAIHNLEQAMAVNNNIIPTGIHFAPGSLTDPFEFDQALTLIQDFQVSAAPTTIINRTIGGVWDEQYTSLENKLNQAQPLGLAISSNISGNNLSIDVSVRFDMNMTSHHINLVLYVVENGLHADQVNGTGYYGGQNPIPNFEHNHVLRAALTGLYGEAIPQNQTGANQTYTYHFSGSIPANIADIQNCEIEAFCIDGNDKNAAVINIQKATIGATQSFD